MDQLIEKIGIEEFGDDPRPCLRLVQDPQKVPELEADDDNFPF